MSPRGTALVKLLRYELARVGGPEVSVVLASDDARSRSKIPPVDGRVRCPSRTARSPHVPMAWRGMVCSGSGSPYRRRRAFVGADREALRLRSPRSCCRPITYASRSSSCRSPVQLAKPSA